MPSNRPAARRNGNGALTRASVRRGGRPRPAPEERPSRLRFLRSPATWLAGILLSVAAVTFQDVLVGAAKSVFSLDRLPDRISPEGAIDVVEVQDVKENGTYVIRGGKGAGAAAATMLGTPDWREKGDVVDVGVSEWMVTLEGRAAQQVRITDIVPEVEGGRCGAPLGGTLVLSPSQGEAHVIPLEVAVDSPTPRMMTTTTSAKGVDKSESYFTGPHAKHITLKQNESEAFLIHATSKQGHCRWRYRVHYQVAGTPAEMVLSRPGNKPFEMTGELPRGAGYRAVHFPPFLCPGVKQQDRWLTATGEAYARARSAGKHEPCPKKES
ncbi:hypothetical protein [Streptomyces sp. NPDC053560]|uniref:hypothetical protein n=1 Tax=Streptomyces sp. NPDC053560 TaxID=3365711 RepID=UPI0037CD1B4C